MRIIGTKMKTHSEIIFPPLLLDPCHGKFQKKKNSFAALSPKKTATYNFSDVVEIFQGALIFLDSLFYSHIFWSVRRLNYHLIHNEDFLSMPQDLINSEKKSYLQIIFLSL